MNLNTLDLVRFDHVRNCFVLKGTRMHKWPDGTPKSMHNAFNWRDNATGILCKQKPVSVSPRSKDMNSNDYFTTYATATGKRQQHYTSPKDRAAAI